ncbi:MAG: spore coat protein U domain-containing protein [Terracidiphilus sp.]
MKYITLALSLGFLVSALASRPSLAATRTASLSITATVVSSCQVSAPATAPGTYTAIRANGATSVSVACTYPTPYNVSHSTGLTPSVTEITRKTFGTEAGTSNGAAQSPSAYDFVTVSY